MKNETTEAFNKVNFLSSKKKISIALLGPKEIFGEEEIIYNLKKRNHTITCDSLLGEVYMITKEVILKYF